MPTDFAKTNRPRARAATRAKPQSNIPGWVWLFTGTVLGAFVMFLMRLSEMPANDSATEAGDGVISGTEQADGEQQPRFDFYQLLKESKVPVPAIETKEPAGAPEEVAQYMLQVASFKRAGDAEQLRAELILLNLEAQIETARVRNGETWHRVVVGPFESRSRLAKARNILVSNRLEALVLKRAAKG